MKKYGTLLVFVLCAVMLAFVACAPKEKTIKEKFENEKYSVVEVSTEVLNPYGINTEDIQSGLFANKGFNNIIVVWFKDSAKAKDVYNKLKENKSINVLRKGVLVAIGTKEAIDII